jgi:hypothetical protein
MHPRQFPVFFAMLALCVAMAAPVVAAEAPGQVAMEELATRLNLSAEQQAQIAPALEQRNSRLKAIADQTGADARAREKVRALREARAVQKEFVGKVTPLLTKEQAAEWEKLRAETRERVKERVAR